MEVINTIFTKKNYIKIEKNKIVHIKYFFVIVVIL